MPEETTGDELEPVLPLRDEPGAVARAVESVASVAAALGSETDPSLVAAAVVRQLGILEARAVALYLGDERERTLRLVAHAGLAPELVERIRLVSLDDPYLVAQAAVSRELRLVEDTPDLAERGLVGAAEMMRRTGCGSAAAMPLIAGEERIGAVVWTMPGRRRFTAEEQRAIRAIGDIFATALRGAEARRRESRLRTLLEQVARSSVRIAEAADLRGVLQALADEARIVAQARSAAVGIDDTLERAVSSSGAPKPSAPHIERPLRLHGRVLGSLRVADKIGAERFDADDEWAIDLLAQQATLLIERSRSHELLLQVNEQLLAEIEERRRVEASLRFSEERYRLLSENSHDLIFRYVAEPRFSIDYVSPSVWDLTGYVPEELYVQPELLLDRARDRAGLERHLRDPGSEPLVAAWRNRAGDWRWLEFRAHTIAEQAGASMLADVRDVTERVEAEAQRERLASRIEAEHRWLQAVIDVSPVGLVLLSRDGLRSNRRAEELLGMHLVPEEGVRQYADRVRRADGSPIALEELPSSRAWRGDASISEENLICRPDGVAIPVLMGAAPLRGESGSIDGVVVAFEDIRALKELERLREEWTAVVAHDLRQPVTVIRGYAGLLERKLRGTPSAPRVEHILSAARQLDRMIADLLDLSRLEANRLSLRLEPIETSPFLRAVAERYAPALDGERLEVRVPDGLPPLRVDADRIEQVIANLLSNAAKYGAPRTPIVLEAEKREDGLAVLIRNQGPGIPRDQLPRLFSRFQRTAEARESGVAGIGLGLYITKGLVEAHGGKVWAESVQGGTTTFGFLLPVP